MDNLGITAQAPRLTPEQKPWRHTEQIPGDILNKGD